MLVFEKLLLALVLASCGCATGCPADTEEMALGALRTGLGHFVLVADDDGDGLPEVILDAEGTAGRKAGFQTAEGDVLAKIGSSKGWVDWEVPFRTFGWESLGLATNCGDLDGDGLEDIVLGVVMYPDIKSSPIRAAGKVTALSGRTGGLLWEVKGTLRGGQFGCGVARMADSDGDGVSEVVVTSRNAPREGRRFGGKVSLLSGATGTVLCETGLVEGMQTQHSVSACGARGSGPGAEFALGLSSYDSEESLTESPFQAGAVKVFTIRNGSIDEDPRVERHGTEREGWFGGGVLGVRDCDGDGFGDLLVDACGEDGGRGRVYLLSSRDLSDILVIPNPDPECMRAFGQGMFVVPDADGDGRNDVGVRYSKEGDGVEWPHFLGTVILSSRDWKPVVGVTRWGTPGARDP